MADLRKLNTTELSKIQSLEKEIGCCLVALQTPPKVAMITESQLMKIQKLESELNSVVLAYNCEKFSTGEIKNEGVSDYSNQKTEQYCSPVRTEED